MNRKKTIFFLFEVLDVLKAGRFCQLAIQAVRPSFNLSVSAISTAEGVKIWELTVVVARKYYLCTRIGILGSNDRIGTMTADIMKATNVALAVHHQEEGEACDIILDIVAGLLEAVFMGNKEPVLGEDSPSLDLIYSGRAVPA